MLVKIGVENFKSFNEAVELTMVSSSKIRTNKGHSVKINNTKLLKYGVIYGANASGKTNIVEFFRFFKQCVEGGIPIEATQIFCKSSKQNKNKKSVFEIQINIGKKFYAYGFEAILSKRKVVGEWLYELCSDGTARLLFDREKNERPVLGKDISLEETEATRFEIYAYDFKESKTSYSSLFLSEMNRGKKYAPQSKLLFFEEVYEWIQNNIIVITPNASLVDFEYYYQDDSLKLVNQLIQTFDTGISQVEIKKISMDELRNSIPKTSFERAMSHIKKGLEIKEDIETINMTMRVNNSFFNIEMKGREEPKVTTIRLQHNKSFYDFGFEEESDGTRRIFDLMDMLLNKRDDVIYVVDELERSLHPKLTAHFLQLFMELHANHRMQLLFTTHEASIMDQAIFRRDEIWFVERNAGSDSHIYSLDRFKERYDKVLSKAYLEGRYGAIPVFSSFEFEEEE